MPRSAFPLELSRQALRCASLRFAPGELQHLRVSAERFDERGCAIDANERADRLGRELQQHRERQTEARSDRAFELCDACLGLTAPRDAERSGNALGELLDQALDVILAERQGWPYSMGRISIRACGLSAP